jgi:hypothetical protein
MLRIGRLREFRFAEQIARAEEAPEEVLEEEVEEAEEEASRDTDPNLELTTLG